MNLNWGVSLFMCTLWKIHLDFFLPIQPGYMSLDGLCFDFFWWEGGFSKILGSKRDYIAFRNSKFPVVWQYGATEGETIVRRVLRVGPPAGMSSGHSSRPS